MSYVPRPIPRSELPDVETLARYVERELQALSRSFGGNDQVPFVELHAEPARPRLGQMVYADGSDWDPGEGAGIYTYSGSGWVKNAGGPLSNRTIIGTANEISVADGNGVSGNPTISLPATIDLGGKTSLEVPNSTGPTVDAAGEIAVDTNTDNSVITHGTLIFYDGTEVRYNVSVATLPSAEGDVLAYNATSKRFEFYAAATQAEQETGTATNKYVSPGRQHSHPSAAKCWAYVTVSGGTPTLQTSFNITSITDTGVGQLTITIGTDFSSANWASAFTYQGTTAGSQLLASNTGEGSVASGGKAAGSILLEVHEPGTGTSGDLVDPGAWNFVGYGDQ